MDNHSSHIDILCYPQGLDGKCEIEEKMLWIPPVFSHLSQDKKDQLWLSFSKGSAESLWVSVWENLNEICSEFHIREQVNKITFFRFLSENDSRVCRLIEHLVLVTNLLVLISQGFKEQNQIQLGSISYEPTQAILFFFGSTFLLIS